MKPVIIGAGLAGLSVALALAPMPVMLLSPRKLGEECASAWAQGGIAAALGTDDSPALHAADTLAAGAGLCDAEIARQVTLDAAEVITHLVANATPFDRDEQGKLALGLEAAHSRRRIVHAKDSTGLAVTQALVKVARATPSIEIIENAIALELFVNDGITGVAIERGGKRETLQTNRVVLATGGAGALWMHTTNPAESWGRGLALAARAGAALGDLEFMQFHPTVIDIGRDPMPLASEALRGEGAILVDETGARFTDELAPRDVVARALHAHLAAGHRTFLDARKALGARFAQKFPAIHAVCMSTGIDPAQAPIPVRPAAHYHMGGVVTDAQGRTNIPGLWACGEVACTGLHGANRLASNSLLEAASFGKKVAEDIENNGTKAWWCSSPLVGEVRRGGDRLGAMFKVCTESPSFTPPSLTLPTRGREQTGLSANSVRTIMSAYVGVLRNKDSLETAIAQLAPLAETSDMALVGFLIASFALRRQESRGAQARTDFPQTSPDWAHRQILTLADLMPDCVNEAPSQRIA